MNTLKCMELPTLWFLTVLEKFLRIPGTSGKPGSGFRLGRRQLLKNTIPSHRENATSSGSSVCALWSSTGGTGTEPWAVPTMRCWQLAPRPGQGSTLKWQPQHCQASTSPVPSATSSHVFNPPGQWSHCCSAQPGLGNASSENISPKIQPKTPLMQLGAISFCPFVPWEQSLTPSGKGQQALNLSAHRVLREFGFYLTDYTECSENLRETNSHSPSEMNSPSFPWFLT